MPMKPLTDEQKTLLKEYEDSNQTIKDFAASKGIMISKIYYIIQKDRELRSIALSESEGFFVPLSLASSRTNKNDIVIPSSKDKDTISFSINGYVISIDSNDLSTFLRGLQG